MAEADKGASAELIERIKQHFSGFGVQTVEVPEWGPQGESGPPLVIYYTPLTLSEKQYLNTIGQRDGVIARLADCLILKAMDASGKKLFTIEHKFALRHGADPDVIARIVGEMMSAPTVKDMEKNSPRTPASG